MISTLISLDSYLLNILTDFGLSYVPFQATHISKTTSKVSLIDLIITREMNSLKFFSHTFSAGLSDHDLIFYSYCIHLSTPVNTYISIINYNSIDVERFQ